MWNRRVKSWLKSQHSKYEDHGIWFHDFMANRETMETVTDFVFLGSKVTADDGCSHEIKRHLLFGRKALTNLDSVIKKQRHPFTDKGPYSQIYGLSSSHVWV